MKTLLLIPIHSVVDVITNSSSELFTIELFTIQGDKEVVENFIKEELSKNNYRHSGNGGDWSVHTLKEEIILHIPGIHTGDYSFKEDKNYWEFDTLITKEEQFKYILEDFLQYLTPEQQTTIRENINNTLVVEIDNGYRELIEDIKELFPNYIRLD